MKKHCRSSAGGASARYEGMAGFNGFYRRDARHYRTTLWDNVVCTTLCNRVGNRRLVPRRLNIAIERWSAENSYSPYGMHAPSQNLRAPTGRHFTVQQCTLQNISRH